MEKPTVHLNGTSRESLHADYRAAWQAVSDAMDALKASAPHPRDYYVQEGNTFKSAAREHGARYQKLREVRDELEALAMHTMKESV